MLAIYLPCFTHHKERILDYLEREEAPTDPGLLVSSTKAPSMWVKWFKSPQLNPSIITAYQWEILAIAMENRQGLPNFQPTDCEM